MKKDKNDDIISSMLSSLDDGMDDLGLGIIGRSVTLHLRSSQMVELVIAIFVQLRSSSKSAGLSEYAKHCLKEICSQEWVREKFLKNPENLFDSDLLLDKMLSHRQVGNWKGSLGDGLSFNTAYVCLQAQQLVQMICYPGGIPSVLPLDEDDEDDEPEEQRHITRILQVCSYSSDQMT